MADKVITLLCLLSLFGCKTPVKTERTVQVDSISVKEVITITSDSVMQQILSSLAFDYEYTFTEWSKPDSTGAQHKEKEHTFKGSGKAEKEVNTVQVSNSSVAEKDSISAQRNEMEIIAPTQVLTWWDKIRIKIGGAWITIIALGLCLFGGWLLIRYIRGRRQ